MEQERPTTPYSFNSVVQKEVVHSRFQFQDQIKNSFADYDVCNVLYFNIFSSFAQVIIEMRAL